MIPNSAVSILLSVTEVSNRAADLIDLLLCVSESLLQSLLPAADVCQPVPEVGGGAVLSPPCLVLWRRWRHVCLRAYVGMCRCVHVYTCMNLYVHVQCILEPRLNSWGPYQYLILTGLTEGS